MQFLPHDIVGITTSIIKAWPYNSCGMPNSVALIHDYDQLEHQNLGMTYDNVLKGEFWGRDYHASGNTGEPKAEYGMLALDIGKPIRKSFSSSEVCYEIYFMFVDVPECKQCPDDCNRSIPQIDQNLNEWTMQFMNQLAKFKLWTVLLNDGAGEIWQQVWATEEMIECWKEEGKIIDCKDNCQVELEMLIDEPDKGFEIGIIDVGIRQHARGCVLKLRICDCLIPKDEGFNYKTIKEPKLMARTACLTC